MLHSSLDDLAHLKSAIFLPLTPSPDKILLSLISKGQIFRLVSTKENNFDIFLPLPNSMTLVLKIWRINQPRDAHAPKTWPGRFRKIKRRIFLWWFFPLQRVMQIILILKIPYYKLKSQYQFDKKSPPWRVTNSRWWRIDILYRKKMIFWPKAVIRICLMMKKF